MKIIRLLILMTVAMTAVSCVSSTMTRQSQYPKLYEEHPVTLLVMPPINNTTNVEAKDLLYTSISKPLVEAGYYVISPLLSLDVLKAESAYDAELFIDGPLNKFGEFFGADAVVFSVIETWAKQDLGIRTKLHYMIKSTKTNEILFDRTCDLYLDLKPKNSTNASNGNAWGALLDLAVSAIVTATTDHIEAARKANQYIFQDIPKGKYHSSYGKDQSVNVSSRDITVTVR